MPRALWSRLFHRRRARPAKPRAARSFRPRLEGLETRTLLSAGDLDPTFGNAGKVLTGFQGSYDDSANAVVRQSDGKYVVAGVSGTETNRLVALARYNPDGSLDTAFGTGGKVLTSVGAPSVTVLSPLVQPDGRVVVAGGAGPDVAASPQTGFLLARYNLDGDLDTTFGTGGLVHTDFPGGGIDVARAVFVEPDGKLVAVGASYSTQFLAPTPIALARYNADGSLDPSFGTGGLRQLPDLPRGGAYAAVQQSDGKILVAGSVPEGAATDAANDIGVVRLNADGSVDTTFGTQGLARASLTTGNQEVGSTITLQPDGRVVVAGATVSNNARDLAVVRFTASGQLDPSFGSGGAVRTDFAGGSDDAAAVTVQADGRIVVSVGQGLVRYNPDGSLDAGFGTGGKVPVSSGVGDVIVDGTRLVATAGASSTGPQGVNFDFGLDRLTADGMFDPTFGTGGKTSTDFAGPIDSTVFDAARGPDGKIVVVGFASSRSSNPFSVLARFNPDGSPDSTFGNGGRLTLDFTGLFVRVQPDNKIVVLGSMRGAVIVARYNRDGSPDTTFGNGGKTGESFGNGTFDEGGSPTAAALAPDGKILVTGQVFVMGRFGMNFLLRFNPDGSPDSAFNSRGGGGRGLAVQPDGKVVAIVSPVPSGPGIPPAPTLERYTATTGQLDPTFGTNGEAPRIPGGGAIGPNSLVIQADGRIVALANLGQEAAVGSNFVGWSLLRYRPDGSPDGSFGAGGQVETVFAPGAVAASLATGASGLLAATGTAPGAGGSDFVVAVYLSDGSLATGFGNGGIVSTDFAGGADTATAVLLQPDNKLVVAGTATVNGFKQFALARYEGVADPAPAPVSDDVRFVTDLYQDLLGRAPDAPGLAANAQPLDAARAQALASVARAFVGSVENRSAVIAGYYTTYLGRAADAGGVRNWLGLLQRGATPEEVLATILGSDEYLQRAGGTNAAFLDRLYRDVLGRDRDPGSQGFLDALNGGQATRAQVAVGLLSSAEYRTRFVTQAYQTFLGRQPNTAEMGPWLQLLAQPAPGAGQLAPSEQVVAGILASAEYLGNNGNSSQTWLDSLYRRLLNRLPDAAGYSANLQFILNAAGAQRQATAVGFVFSQEYLAKTVGDAYLRFLGRAASPEEVAPRVDALRRGLTQEQLVAGIAASDEAFRHAGGTNAAWLDALYQGLLGRGTAGDPGAQGFLDALNQNQVTRVQVATFLASSDEYRRHLVQTDYTTYLGRQAGDAEAAFWAAVLQRGERQEQLLADIVASAEYFQQAGQRR
jgi:uncharacterized delta-60 repeat protein